MKFSLIQAMLAATDGEDTGWMQLLVFVILAVLYGLANIVKGRAQKAKELEEEEGFELSKTAKKAPARTVGKKPYPKVKTPRPVIRHVPRKQPLPAVVSQEIVQKITIPTSQELVGEPLKEERKIEIISETVLPKTGIAEKSLVDLDDPEELRKAILHYEILSKPLSLREELYI